MRIVYRVTEEDYMAAHDLYAKNDKLSRRIARNVPFYLGIGLVLLSIFNQIMGRDFVGNLILAVGGTLFMYCRFALRRYFKKRYRGDQRYQHEIAVEISEEGARTTTPTMDSSMKWNVI